MVQFSSFSLSGSANKIKNIFTKSKPTHQREQSLELQDFSPKLLVEGEPSITDASPSQFNGMDPGKKVQEPGQLTDASKLTPVQA